MPPLRRRPLVTILRPFLLGVLAVALAVGGDAVHGQPAGQPAQLSIAFGPSEVWQPSSAAVQQLHACTGQSFTCVRMVMQQNGASQQAIAFYQLTAWFLIEIQESGVVQIGTILNPWAANENQQYALLGGVPAVIFPNDGAASLASSLPRNPTYAAIQSAHEDAMYWPFGPRIAGVETSPEGGQRFLFDYEVLNGCHACAILAHVRIAFDFATDGTEAGVRVVEVIPEATP
jgi:hypothetical protein